jgi:hypothetical protein
MAAKLLSAVASCPASAPRLVRIGLDLGFGRNDRVGDLSFEKSHRMSFSVFCGRELPRHQQARAGKQRRAFVERHGRA